MIKGLVLAFVFLVSSVFADVNFAPLYQSQKNEEQGYQRALGPIFEHRSSEDFSMTAIRPLWSRQAGNERKDWDVLWPFFMKRQYRDYYRSNYLLFFYHDQNLKDAASPWNAWLFPIYYQGRGRDGEDYVALWPIWGKAHDIFGYDWLSLRFFPIYAESQDGRINTKSWLWPFISHAKSEKMEKKRYFPFYGYVDKQDDYYQEWYLWPFYQKGYSKKESKPGKWFFYWPFYGKIKYDDFEKTSVLWPFFSWSKGKDWERRNLPWPFYQEAEGKLVDKKFEKTSFWPFYSSMKSENRHSRSIIWPFYGDYEMHGEDPKVDVEMTWLFPFYWDFSKVKEDKVVVDYTRYWPLLSIDRGENFAMYNALDILPFRRVKALERNYNPLWRLYLYMRHKDGYRHDVLWGLIQAKKNEAKAEKSFSFFPFYEQEKKAEDKSWNVLKGLFGREHSGEESKTRLLWFFRF